MMTRLWVLACCLAATASLSAQRDVPAGTTSARAAIAGRVGTTDTPSVAVRGAIVVLSGGASERTTVTDDDGRFVFEDLSAGRYTVRARKPAWVETTWGAIRPGGPGTPVALEAGARRELEIPLVRGAAVEGRVTLPDGRPAVGTTVRAQPVGATPLRGVDAALTDDRGVYRLFGLPPGEYVIVVNPPPMPMSMVMQRPTTQQVDAALQQLANRSPGRTTRALGTEPIVHGSQAIYAPIHYPGVAARDQAQSLTLAAGEERVGIDIVFAVTMMSRVAGRLVGPVASFAAAQVRMQPRVRANAPTATVSSDGTFVFDGVVPGTYDLIAQLDPTRTPPDPNAPRIVVATGRGGAAGASSEGTLWASVETFVSGQDIEGLVVAVAPGSLLTGRVRFADSTVAPPDLSGTTVRLTPLARPEAPVMLSPGLFSTMQDRPVEVDGTFRLAGIGPGRYQMSVTMPTHLAGERWWAHSAVAGDVDLLDVPVEFAPGRGIEGVDVVLSQRRASLSGRLQLSDGRPGSDYFVIAFSPDPRMWQALSRRTHAARPADDGTFQLEDMPAGDYLIAVLTDFEPASLNSAEFFRDTAPLAVSVTLAEGEEREQSFEIRRP